MKADFSSQRHTLRNLVEALKELHGDAEGIPEDDCHEEAAAGLVQNQRFADEVDVVAAFK